MYLAILIVLVLIFIYFVDKKERNYDKEPKQEPTTLYASTALKLYNPDDLNYKSNFDLGKNNPDDLKLFY